MAVGLTSPTYAPELRDARTLPQTVNVRVLLPLPGTCRHWTSLVYRSSALLLRVMPREWRHGSVMASGNNRDSRYSTTHIAPPSLVICFSLRLEYIHVVVSYRCTSYAGYPVCIQYEAGDNAQTTYARAYRPSLRTNARQLKGATTHPSRPG